jgi:retron-type reverse transcriptase
MKSYTGLYEQICTFPALYRAYQLCRRGKREREYAIEFEQNREHNLFALRDELVEGRWRPGKYSRFFVEDPKRRLINAPPFRDRIVHHAVSTLLIRIWDPTFPFGSFACRVGKGTHAATDRLQQFMRRYPAGSGYVLQLDVKSYFASIDHEILIGLVAKRIRDRRFMRLIRQIVKSYGDGPDVGIPLGNLTSQVFANIYLHELDMFAKHDLRIKHYIRYMDDVALVHEDKRQLWEWRDEIEAFLSDRLRLRLHRKKQVLAPVDCGVKYLGYWIYRDHIRVLARNVRRVYRRLRQMEAGTFKGDARASISSWVGYAKHADTHGLNCQIAERHPFLRVAFEPIEAR